MIHSDQHKFEYMWITPARSELWDGVDMFSKIAYDRLPDVPQFGDDLSWIEGVYHPFPFISKMMQTHFSGPSVAKALLKTKEELLLHNLALPKNFERFASDPKIYMKLSGYADYGLIRGNNTYDSDGTSIGYLEDGRIYYPFLDDGQGFVTWFLLFNSKDDIKVLVSPLEISPDFMDPEEEFIEQEDVIYHCYVCANSFNEFIYRFWIEITFSRSEKFGFPLNKRQLDYKNQIELQS
ncbi:MAG: hypothetical protein AAF902_21035 [Chloroflexota bacterium]